MSTTIEERTTLRGLIAQRVLAEKDVCKQMVNMFPIGSVWGVVVRHGQVNLSEMTVTGHSSDGSVRMSMPKKKRRGWKVDPTLGYKTYKSIHWEKIITRIS